MWSIEPAHVLQHQKTSAPSMLDCAETSHFQREIVDLTITVA